MTYHPKAVEYENGEAIGRDPREMSIKDLEALGHKKQPRQLNCAIRSSCLDCSVYQPSEVRRCVSYSCSHWPFRMGTNPFHQRGRNGENSS